MSITFLLAQPFAQHALLAAALVAVACGLIGPFVVTRGMAFAVHGTAELAFTGAAAGWRCEILAVYRDAAKAALLGIEAGITAAGPWGLTRERGRRTGRGAAVGGARRAGGLARGLTGEQAWGRLERFGPNEIAEEHKSLVLVLLGYFWVPIPWMIEVALVLSLVVRHWTDAAVIGVLLVMNVAVAFTVEH